MKQYNNVKILENIIQVHGTLTTVGSFGQLCTNFEKYDTLKHRNYSRPSEPGGGETLAGVLQDVNPHAKATTALSIDGSLSMAVAPPVP